MTQSTDEQTYNPVDICDWFGISRTTLFRWEQNGEIPKTLRGPGGRRFYRRQHLKRIMELVRQKIGEDNESYLRYNPGGRLSSPEDMERLYLAEFFGGSDPTEGLEQLRGLAVSGTLSDPAIKRLVEYALKQPRGDPIRQQIWDLIRQADQ